MMEQVFFGGTIHSTRFLRLSFYTMAINPTNNSPMKSRAAEEKVHVPLGQCCTD